MQYKKKKKRIHYPYSNRFLDYLCHFKNELHKKEQTKTRPSFIKLPAFIWFEINKSLFFLKQLLRFSTFLFGLKLVKEKATKR